MKSYFNLDGWDVEHLPEIQAWREGSITRILHDIDYVPEHEVGDEVIPAQIVADSVDVIGEVTYGTIISEVIRGRYSADDTEAILANYNLAKDESSPIDDEHRSEYLSEYNEYQEWRAHAKEVAKAVLNLL